MLAVAGAAVVAASSGVAARTTPDCSAFRKTVSPTHSRLWTANHQGRWAASPAFVNADGSMWLKAPWFAAGPPGHAPRGPRGVLTITGKRIDQPAAPLEVEAREVGLVGYGGSGVWAVVLTFPSEGCWSVTGRVERTMHTFRLLVTREGPAAQSARRPSDATWTPGFSLAPRGLGRTADPPGSTPG